MGGDHKCPVCQATFTRPQHVARHMRSHTGDRPYKCQHCGDQFARSDLLSRHVNKCHANEKQLVPQTSGRRKGSASATRATTSKQACDQCVQASLPCDGCNPCAKCVQRKCRCTFVKFHRQTAPVGPGHNPNPRPPAAQNVPPTIGQLYQTHPTDDFMLSYAGTSTQPPTQSQFNPASVWSGWRGQAGSSAAPPKYPGSSSTNPSPATNYDYPPYVRKQGSLESFDGGPMVRGDALEVNGIPHMAFPNASGMVMGRPPQTYQHHTSSASPDYAQQTQPHDYQSDYSSDYASSQDGNGHYSTSSQDGHYQDYSRTSSQDEHSFTYDPPAQGEGFSSAFGLMSLDDPNVLAGLANDGVPFFSNPPPHPSSSSADKRPSTSGGYQQSQPQPNYAGLGGQTPSAGRDAETKELKEFWKQYMRTPLTGPGGGGWMPTPGQGPQGLSGQNMYEGGRRHRVSSLPSVKTPTGVMDTFMGGHKQQGNPTQQRAAGNMGAVDDLRSYEAAVLSRKTPNLSLDSVVLARARKHHPQPASARPPPPSALLPPISHIAQPHVHYADSPQSSSRESSVGASGGGAGRPSFKRLASQTLGPEETKFAKKDSDALDGTGLPVSNY